MRVKRSVDYTANMEIEGMLHLSLFPYVQTGRSRLTTQPAAAFLCRPAKLLCQLIIDWLTGIIVLCTGPFGDGRSVS